MADEKENKGLIDATPSNTTGNVKEEGYALDYMKGYLQGWSTPDFLKNERQEGLPTMLFSKEHFQNTWVKDGHMNQEDLDKLYPRVYNSFESYKRKEYNDFIESKWNETDGYVLRNYNWESQPEVGATELPLGENKYGVKTASVQQVASMRGDIEYNGKKYSTVEEFKDNETSPLSITNPILEQGFDDNGNPQWFAKDYSAEVNRSRVRTIWGDQKLHNNFFTTAISGIPNSTIQMLVGGAGVLALESQYATGATEDDVGKNKTLNAGNAMVNLASKLMIKPSEAQLGSAFSNKEAFGWALSQVVGQLALQYATVGVGTAAGLSAKVAQNASIGTFSVLMMDSFNELSKENNIPYEDRAWILPLVGLTTFGVEKYVGQNIFNTSNKYLHGKRAVTKELNEMAAASYKKAGVKAFNDLSQDQKANFATKAARYMVNQIKSKEVPTSFLGMAKSGAIEEGTEEVVEGVIDELIMSIHDYYGSAVGAKPGDGQFNEMNKSQSFLPQFLKRVPHGLAEEGVLGAIGGLVGGTFRGATMLNKAAKDHLYHMVAQGQEEQALEYIESLRNDKMSAPDWTDGQKIFDETYNGETKSLNDQRSDMLVNMVQEAVQLRDTYGIRSPEALKVMADKTNLLDESFIAAKNIETAQNSLRDLTAKTNKGEELTADELKLQEELNNEIATNKQNLDDIINPEWDGARYSKRYNDISKENILVQEETNKGIEFLYPRATSETKESKEYLNAKNELMAQNLAKTTIHGYQAAYDFNKQFKAWEQTYFEGLKERENVRVENKDAVADVISNIKNIKSGKDFSKTIDSIMSELEKISSVSSEGIDSEQLVELKKNAKRIFISTAQQVYGDRATEYQKARKLEGDERDAALTELRPVIQGGSQADLDVIQSFDEMAGPLGEFESVYGDIESIDAQEPIPQLGEQQRKEKFYIDNVDNSIGAASSIINADESLFNETQAREELSKLKDVYNGAVAGFTAANSFYSRVGKVEDNKVLNQIDRETTIDDTTFKNVNNALRSRAVQIESLEATINKKSNSRNVKEEKEWHNRLAMDWFSIENHFTVASGRMSNELQGLIKSFRNNEAYESILSIENRQKSYKLTESDIGTITDVEKDMIEIKSFMHIERAKIYDGKDALSDILSPFLEGDSMYYSRADDYEAKPLLDQMMETNQNLFTSKILTDENLHRDMSYVHYVNFITSVYSQNANDLVKSWIDYMANNEESSIHPSKAQQQGIELANAMFNQSLKEKKDRIFEKVFKVEKEYDKVYKKANNFSEKLGNNDRYRIGNSISFRGFFGTGKTEIQTPQFFLFRNEYEKIVYEKDTVDKHEAIIFGPTAAVESKLREALKDVVKLNDDSVSFDDIINGRINLKDKTLIWDEFSLLNDSDLIELKNVIEDEGSRLIALVDDKQMKDVNNVQKFGNYSQIGLRAPVLTTKYSTDIPMINLLADAFRVSRENDSDLGDLKKGNIFPLLYSEKVNGIRVGGQYYKTEKDVVQSFLEALSEDNDVERALVVFNEKHLLELAKDYPQLDKHKSKIFYIAKDISKAKGKGIDSVQGLRKAEVYIAIKLEGLPYRETFKEGRDRLYKGIESDVGYTAVGRASKGVFLVGNPELNAKSKDEVSWVLPGEVQSFQDEIQKSREFDKTRFKFIVNEDFDTTSPTIDKAIKEEPAITPKKAKAKKQRDVKYEELSDTTLDGISIDNNYVDDTGKRVTVDMFLKKDGVNYVLVNNKEYKTKDFKFTEVEEDDSVLLKLFKRQAEVGDKDIWSSSYTVYRASTHEDVADVRKVSPIMMASSGTFSKTLYYVKSGMVWNEEGTGRILENDLLLVGVDYKNSKAKDEFLIDLKPKVNGAIYKEFSESKTIPSKYKYLTSLADTEYNYDSVRDNRIIKDHSNLQIVIDRINNGFRSTQEDQYKESNKAANITKAKIRNYGYNKWNSSKDIGPIAISAVDEIGFNEIEQTVKYNPLGIKDVSIQSKIKELKRKGLSIGSPVYSSLEDGIPGVTVKYSWGDISQAREEDVFKAFMPKMKSLTNKASIIKNDKDILRTINNNSEGLSEYEFRRDVNSKLRQTFIYNLIANNRSLITNSPKILMDEYGKYITFIGNTVRVLDAETLKNNGYISKKTGYELEAEVLGKLYFNTTDLSTSTAFKIINDELFQPLMLDPSDYQTPDARSTRELLTNVETINTPNAFVNISKLFDKKGFGETTTEPIVNDDWNDVGDNSRPEVKVKDLSRRDFATLEETENLIELVAGKEFLDNKTEFKNKVFYNGVEVWGKMFNGAIQLELSKKGIKNTTPKHELMHVMTNYILDDSSKRAILDEAKKAMKLNETSLGDITDIQADEWLSMTYGKSGTRLISNKQGFVNSWYTPSGLLERFKAFLDTIFGRMTTSTTLLNKLMYELDSGNYRDSFRNLQTNGEEISRAEGKEVDSEDIIAEDVQLESTNYDNYSNLTKVFGDRYYVDQIKKVIKRKIFEKSLFNPDIDSYVSPTIGGTVRTVKTDFSNPTYIDDKGEFKASGEYYVVSLEKKVSEMNSTDFHRIINTDGTTRGRYIEYQLGKEEILNTFIRKISPDLDIEALITVKTNRTNVIEGSYGSNYKQNVAPIIDTVIEMTPYREWDSSTETLLPGRRNDYINTAIAQNIFEQAGMEMLKEYDVRKSQGLKSDKLQLLFLSIEKLTNGDEDIFNNTAKSILSFLDKNDTDGKFSIKERMNRLFNSDNLENNKRAINLQKFFSAFINAYSIGKREQIVIEVSKNKDGENVYTATISHNNHFEDIKNRLVSTIKGTLYGNEGTFQADEAKVKEFNNKFKVDSSGLSLKTNNIKVISAAKVKNGYNIQFTENADSGMATELANFIGLRGLNGNVISSIFDNQSPQFGEFLRKKNLSIGKKTDNKTLLAEGLYNMFIAFESNIDAVEYYNKQLTSSLKNNLSDVEADKAATVSLGDYQFKHNDIIENYRDRVKASNIDGQIESQSNRDDVDVSSDLRLPKPYDYYNFLNAIGKVEEYKTGGSTRDTFSRSASNAKVYNYTPKSVLFDTFISGSKSVKDRFLNALETMSEEEVKENPLIAKNGDFLNLFLMDTDITLTKLRDSAGLRVKQLSGQDKLTPSDRVEADLANFVLSLNSQGKKGTLNLTLSPLADKGTTLFSEWAFSQAKLVDGFNYKNIKLNEAKGNFITNVSFQRALREHELSIERWKKVLNIKEDTDFTNVEELKVFLNKLEGLIKSKGQELVDTVQSTDLRETGDYQLKKGILRIGNATRFGVEMHEDDVNITVYSQENLDAWNKAKSEKAKSALRDGLQQDNFIHYASVMSNANYKVPSDASNRISGQSDYYNEGEGGSIEWNPFFKAHFYAQYLLNSQINDIIMGHIFYYNSSSERTKRFGSKNTGGTGLNTDIKYGLSNEAHTIVGKDNIIDLGNGRIVEVGDGESYGSSLFKMFFDVSAGGTEYGAYDNTMQKSIYNGMDYKTGIAQQHKEAIHYITGDDYVKSHTLRFLSKLFLQEQDKKLKEVGVNISLEAKFNEFYDRGGAVRVAKDYDDAMEKLHMWIEQSTGDNTDAIKNTLIWKYQNRSATKTMRRRVNTINLREGTYEGELQTEIAYTDNIKTILNLHQDVNEESTVASPMQNETVSLVGDINRVPANQLSDINKRMADIELNKIKENIKNTDVSDYVGKYKKQEQFRRYLRNLGVEKMPDLDGLVNVKKLIEDLDVSMDVPEVRNRLNTLYRNYVSESAIRIRMSGFKANQTSGYVISKYVDQNGTSWMLNELEIVLDREIDITEEVISDDGDTYTLERLKPMDPGEQETIRGEIVAPYMYKREFGVREGETINQFFSLHFTNGDGYNFKHHLMNSIEMRDTFLMEYDDIDFENTPILRDINLEAEGLFENKSENEIREFIFGMYYEKLLQFNETLNVVGQRIPGTGLSSGGIYKMIAWTNDNGNIVYYPDEKNYLDDSDNDGDQLSIITRDITDGYLTSDGRGALQNEKVDIYDFIYKNKGNQDRIFIDSNTQELENLANENDKNDVRHADQYATDVVDYASGREGSKAIGISVNTVAAYDHIVGLGKTLIKRLTPGFTHLVETINETGANSVSSRLKDWVQVILDNANTNVLGRLNVTANTVSVVSDMVQSGVSDEDIVAMFNDKDIQGLNWYVSLGDKVSNPKADFDLLDKVDKEIGIARSNVTTSITDDTQLTESELLDLETEKVRLTDKLDILESFREHVVRAYSQRRLAQIISVRKGIKALNFDFGLFASNVQLTLGMTLDDYNSGTAWNIGDHIEYYKENNNAYLKEIDGEVKEDMVAREIEVAEKMNIAEVVRNIPHIHTYINEIGRQISEAVDTSFQNSQFAENTKSKFLKTINLASFDFVSRLASFNNAFQNWVDSIWFSENVTEPISLPMVDVSEGEFSTRKTVYDSIDLSTTKGRALYSKRFPGYVSDVLDALDQNNREMLTVLTGEQNLDELFDNEFVNRLIVTRRRSSDFVSLADTIQLTQDEGLVAQLTESFKRLPDNFKLQFQMYEIILNGLNFKKGSMMDVMGTDLYKIFGMSEFLDGLRSKISNMSVEDQEILSSEFIKQAQHEQRLTNNYDKKAFNKGVRPSTYIGTEAVSPNYSRKVLFRHVSGDEYVKEYVGNSKTSNPYNGLKQANVTRLQPVLSLSANDLNTVETSTKENPLQIQFLKGHNYTKSEIKDNIETANYFITATGVVLEIANVTNTSVSFFNSGLKITDLTPEQKYNKDDRDFSIKTTTRYTNDEVKNNPNIIYVFGDNTDRRGKGGQAIIRDNSNAFGIATKIHPTNNVNAFMTDNNYEENIRVIKEDIDKIKNDGRPIIFPKDGFGTGLARLKEKAPRTYKFLKDELLKEFGFNNDTGIVQDGQASMNLASKPNINFVLKVIDALGQLQRNKFSKDKLQGWINDLQKQGITNQQIELFKDTAKDGMTKDEIIVSLIADYSFTVEVNISKDLEAPNDYTETQSKYYQNQIDNADKFYTIREIDSKFEVWERDYIVERDISYGVRDIASPKFDTRKDAESYKKNLIDESVKTNTEELNKIQSFINKNIPTQHYANLTVPGGTNYTENEISTPLITPNIKGHAQFSTDQGIGWFRSDEVGVQSKYEYKTLKDGSNQLITNDKEIGSKTRRILEVQSDLFQKGRDKKDLISLDVKTRPDVADNNILTKIKQLEEQDDTGFSIGSKITIDGIDYEINVTNGKWRYAEFQELKQGEDKKDNQFLQILNKKGNWVNFFIQSIVQDSAKKGYDKVLFPTGETAARVEEHQTIADDINRWNANIQQYEDAIKDPEKYKTIDGFINEETGESEVHEIYEVDLGSGGISSGSKKDFVELLKKGIKTAEEQKANLKTQGIEKLKPIEAFYTNRVANILNKLYDVKQIIDEYGNTWNEVEINLARDTRDILLSKTLNSPKQNFEQYNGETVDRNAMRRIVRQIKKLIPGMTVYDIDGKGMVDLGYGNDTKSLFLDGALYVNMENFNEATPVHELSHIMDPIIEQVAPELFKRINAEAQTHIDGKSDLYNILVEKYGDMSNERMLGEIRATLAGFHSVEKVHEWLNKNNYKGEVSYARSIWDEVKSWIQDVVNAIKGFFSTPTSDIWALDFDTASLRDFYDALVSDFTNGNLVLTMNEEDVNIIKSSLSKGEASKNLSKYELKRTEPVKDIRDIVAYLNNNTTSVKALSDLNEGGLVNYFYNNLRINPVTQEKTLSFRGKEYVYSGTSDANTVKENIRTGIVVDYNKAKEKFPIQAMNYIIDISNGEGVLESAKKHFSTSNYDSNMSFAVANRLANIFHAREPIIQISRYSDLKNNDITKELYVEGFEGFDPLVAIHSIDSDGTFNMSIIDINISSLGRHGINLEDHGLLSTLQSTSQSNRDGVVMNNTDGDIKKLLLGMTMMAMAKNNKIRVRTLGAAQVTSKSIDTRLVADLDNLVHTIKTLTNNQFFKPVIDESNSMVNSILTDQTLYEKEYKQALIDRITTYYASDDKKNNYQDMHGVLTNDQTTVQDLMRMFTARIDKLEGNISDEEPENKIELEMLSQSLLELVGKRDLFTVESMRDMAAGAARYTGTHNIASDALQLVAERVKIVKNINVKETFAYLERMKDVTNEAISRHIRTPEGKRQLVSSGIRDEGSKWFERMVVKRQVIVGKTGMKVDKIDEEAGAEVEVLVPELHWDKTNKLTKEALARGDISLEDLDYANKWLDEYEVREIRNEWWRRVKHNRQTDNIGKETYTLEQAKKDFLAIYERGHIPVMSKSLSELLWKGDFRNVYKRFTSQMKNVEEFMEDEVENTSKQKNINEVSSVFKSQNDRKAQLEAAGLFLDENNVYHLINAENNGKMSTNLWKLGAYHQMSSIRAENYESGVLPYYNAVQVMFPIMKIMGYDQTYNRKWLEGYINRVIFRKTEDTQEGGEHVNANVVVRTMARLYSNATLFGRVKIGVNSLIFNQIQGATNTIANSIANIGIDEDADRLFIPSPKDYYKAHALVFSDFKKTKALSDEFQLVNRQEEDLINNPFISPTDKQWFQEQWGHFFNWATDAYARRTAMVAMMIMEGSWDAYTYNPKTGLTEYDWKKDDRYYSNGNQTEEQKALLKGLINDMIDQKIMEKPDNQTLEELFSDVISGKVKLPRGHDYLDSDNFKWFADKYIIGGMDTLAKNNLSNHYLGAALQQFRLFGHDRLWNAGLFAQTRSTTSGGIRKAVKIDGEVISIREQIQIEGQLQSLGKAFNAIKKVKEMNPKEWWVNSSPVTRMNLAKSVMQVAVFVIAYAFMKGVLKDDEKKQLNFVKALNDFYIVVGAWSWIRNPLPTFSALDRMVDIIAGRKGAEELFRYIPGPSAIKDVQEFYNMGAESFDWDEIETLY